jgi:hypothetical protein
MDAATLLTRLAAVIDAHDWERLPDLLHDDFRCRLVHTGELFGRDAWVRLVADGERGVLRARVIGTDDDGEDLEFAVASFATARDDLLVDLVEVWTDVDQQPPPGTRPVA